ncbi:MAG: DUF4037 domain-containing protein, partial [Parasporobacterium sp.]|nr:DUF4037 domain-containing protein [Parasporobacterium sp.]
MKGIELSRQFYEQWGREMIETNFPEYAGRIAVGLAGEGSECLGFDDDISTDHDFEPGFCLWLTREDYQAIGFKLERAYAKRPAEFATFHKLTASPVGGSRHGVMIIEEFFEKFLGVQDIAGLYEDPFIWLNLPSFALAEATDGEIFRDDLGQFTAIRNRLLQGYPEDIRRKKLAAHLILMAQSGQYNYDRCLKHGEEGAAQLAAVEFVKHAISVIFLLNNAYEPFYKWVYRAMKQLKIQPVDAEKLIFLTASGNDEATAAEKKKIIEEISAAIIEALSAQHLVNHL